MSQYYSLTPPNDQQMLRIFQQATLMRQQLIDKTARISASTSPYSGYGKSVPRAALNPFQGINLFEYAPYQANYPRRLIDWKKTAKFRTPMVKKNEHEPINHLLFHLDASDSMLYPMQHDIYRHKYDYAVMMMIAVAMGAFAQGAYVTISQKSNLQASHSAQLHKLIKLLYHSREDILPKQLMTHHAHIFILSDFFHHAEKLQYYIKQSRQQRKNTGMLLQILSSYEADFEFKRPPNLFDPMKRHWRKFIKNPTKIKDDYLRHLHDYQRDLSQKAQVYEWQFLAMKI